MRLERPSRALPVVSIVPLIDVLLILLVFFMVTSTFLDLDMIPLTASDGAPVTDPQDPTASVLIRVVPSGEIVARGQHIAINRAGEFLASLEAVRLLVLPSPQADLQSLVAVLDQAAAAGLTDVQVVRLGAGE